MEGEERPTVVDGDCAVGIDSDEDGWTQAQE